MGQLTHRANITDISNAKPCIVTIDANDGSFITGAQVRLTDLNGMMPVPRGEDPINNKRYKIVLTGDITFKIKDPITDEEIDSTNFPPYVTGGSCNLIETEFFYYGE